MVVVETDKLEFGCRVVTVAEIAPVLLMRGLISRGSSSKQGERQSRADNSNLNLQGTAEWRNGECSGHLTI